METLRNNFKGIGRQERHAAKAAPETKIANLEARRAKWERKMKAARTWLGKINRSLKYWERKAELAVAANQGKTE